MAVQQADFAGLAVHVVGERRLAARQSFGDDDAGVVARLDDDAAQQVLDRNFGIDLDEHFDPPVRHAFSLTGRVSSSVSRPSRRRWNTM